MRISVVTISFNQAQFIEQCIDSVLAQRGVGVEHIIVDACSTDGTAEVLERRRGDVAAAIVERDRGPADGLNKGFARATGEILYYLNADDIVLPGAFLDASKLLAARPDVDVLCGHGLIVDPAGTTLRRVWSTPISKFRLACGAAPQVQPSTFIRRSAFDRTTGFNVLNRSSWDGELIVDLFQTGSRFLVIDRYWSGFRLHGESITASGRMASAMAEWNERRFQTLMGRDANAFDAMRRNLFRAGRILRRPSAVLDRLRGGGVFGSFAPTGTKAAP